ncbi:uncharacterized protein N7518_005840 [Penicillium psychrosexuale]|uniref:uncharacterized protein n=1 Tax=Penicillium psychrosexuale TaxID=1002107 RepID=UPI002545832A|nr:uncharacterized protein N7518_005840 [Penicillium psychrosexuale]KAJ5788829.1 hypothetical protein N7518_005840 [Penicillium psychrosexuale]
MAALVQTIPQQSGTVPVLQTRPSSSSGTFSSSTQNQGSRIQTMSWTSFNAGNSGTYRAGHPVVAPYAYNPNMGQSVQNRQSWTPHLRPEHRTFSAPTTPQVPVNPTYTGASPRSSHPAAGSRTSLTAEERPAAPSPIYRQPSLPPIMNISSPKPSPNRYRRTPQRAEAAPSSPAPSPIPTVIVDDFGGPRPVRPSAHSRVSSVDDSSYVDRAQPERYRRRSLGNMDAAAYPNLPLDFPTSPSSQPQSGSYDFITFDANQRPASSHSQRDSVGSVNSTHSSASSVGSFTRSHGNDAALTVSISQAREGTPSESNSVTSKTGKTEEKRTSKPSPLSQPVSTEPEAPKPKPPAEAPKKPPPPTLDSPAAKRLNDLKMDTKRPGKSRLRRAFSFGSASELLKTSAQSNASKREAFAADQARREALREQLGPEQAAIAEQQELSGLGESIYSHQGHFFTGSNDNLSVSSTASSASMMLRKMGKGMKRSTRSLVGMFRPKSVASINSMEGAIPEIPAPQITVVNVEAERERVAVNPDPADLPRGATVFPKVDNASEVRRSVSIRERAASENSQSRKSIMGGDRERAEILAAVRKGILKKTHSDFGVSSPAHALPGGDSPHSSAPPTPDESSRSPAHQNDPVKIAGEDYFLSARFSSSEAKSAPITPSTVAGRNIVFSPRIQFHETWPSGEYDRRGEIATCNRLTPLLAQQIREEINNFKMEMEVHENSKIYTHFI